MVNQQAHEAAFWQALYNTTTSSTVFDPTDEPAPVPLRPKSEGSPRKVPSVNRSMLDIVDFKLVSGQSDDAAKLKLEQQPNTDLKTPNSSFDFISGADADSFSAFLGPSSVVVQPPGSAGNAATVGNVHADRSLMTPFECSTLPDIEFLPPDSSADDSVSRGSASKKSKRKSGSPHTSLQQLPFDDPAYKPLRAGLRNRSRKVVTKFENSTDVEPAKPKRAQSGTAKRKRHPPTKIDPEEFALEGSNRQERPLPPDLDEKQTRRILRNRASAERSRLRRLCKITALEQENAKLRADLEVQQKEAGHEALERENRQLKAELQLMRDRVETLTSILSKHRTNRT